MMELNISKLVNDPYFEASNHSGSAMELGQDAGKITWNNSLNSECNLIISDEIKEAVITHFEGFGAWDDVADWPTKELNALLIQFISGDIRELDCIDLDDPEYFGNIFEGTDGSMYYQLIN